MSERDACLLDRQQGAPFPLLGYDEEQAAQEAVRRVAGHTMLSYESLVTLWQQVQYLDNANVQGALVECGTWRGGACALMAIAHQASGAPTRVIHLFDSFVGLPEPDAAKDGEAAAHFASGAATGRLSSIGSCVATVAENKQAMHQVAEYPERLTRYHEGWFQDTVPAAREVGQIALLRLDGDWYESTVVCLNALVPRVASGGIVVIDDYGHWQGCNKAVQEFVSLLHYPVLLHHIDRTARYWVVP